MNRILWRSWWMLALRGILAIAFGVLAFVWPGLTLLWLVAFFAAYAIVGGVASLAAGVSQRGQDEDWWLLLLLGIVGIVAGAIAIMHPGITALVLVLIMGANALVTGVLDIVMAIRLRKVMRGEWLLMLAGAISIVFGVWVFLYPGAGALALVWLISIYAIATGILLLALAFRARAWRSEGASRDFVGRAPPA
ncbi:MAG TPA: HdeD family acid-resistance protein [Casimicrobiaceae bacterium]|nr:HdeD family acid-resistance protein [Casimicrobiaceae bacterium]